MGYYIRVLSPRGDRVPLAHLHEQLKKSVPKAELTVEGGDEQNWTDLLVKVGSRDVCELSCDFDSGPDCLLRREMEEFVEDIANERPQSAARWLAEYLRTVRSIYAFRVLFGDDGGDWETIGAVKDVVREWAGGIIQADNEGFSNESGYHILWQFPASVTGEWHMAVLNAEGRWLRFAINLGSRAHREAFLRGEVPKGVKLEPE